MNVNRDPEHPLDSELWERPDMRAVLRARDIRMVFRLLQRLGIAQRRIAALTGQSQSEISEILKGRRVLAYDVLARICDGLGIPRGHMGLAYTEDLVAGFEPNIDDLEVRRLLARVAEVAVGVAAVDPHEWLTPLDARIVAPAPAHIGPADVERLEEITVGLRALDRRHGGGACRDAVAAQAGWASQLLVADAREDVRRRLYLALADLHNLAGWTSLDVGLYVSARRHFMRAAEQAKHAQEPSLVAKSWYCLGRLYLHRGRLQDALRLLQLGEMAAQEAGCAPALAMLHANQAWTYGLLNDPARAARSTLRAEDEFARANPQTAPVWMRFFNAADLDATVAMANVRLPRSTAQERRTAIEGFGRSLAARGPDMARSRAFELTALATVHLLDGDLDHGAAVGQQAADLAVQVRSQRVIDRLEPLGSVASRYTANADVRELAERIATLRAA